MSSKIAKTTLKEAKEAIKLKDYPLAISKCKEVLKEDEQNYMALLLLGAAYQKSDKKEAAKYLKLALNATTEPTVALQGLANCAADEELPDIYKKLLQLTPDQYADIHTKLLSLSPKFSLIIIEIFAIESLIDSNPARLQSALDCCSQICVQLTQYDEKWNGLFEKSLKSSIANRQIENHNQIFKRLLKLLNAQRKLDELLVNASEMVELYGEDVYPLEWICMVYVEQVENGRFDLQQNLQKDIAYYVEQLVALSPSSTLGLMSRGLILVKDGNFLQAREVLLKVNELKPNWPVCLKTLAAIYFGLKAYALAEYFYRQSQQLTSVQFLQCLVEQNDKLKCAEAIRLCKELLPAVVDLNDQANLIEILTKALITNHQFEAAQKTIEKLVGLGKKNSVNLLLAQKYRAESKSEECLRILEENAAVNSAEYYLLLGQSYMDVANYTAALAQFLNAAKLEPFNCNCFYWLAKVYLANDDTARARKCLEKCVYLNPQHEQCVVLLSTLYRQAEAYEANNNLLQSAIRAVPGGQCKWAQIQLGFHYMALTNYTEAIASFRQVLRIDVDDIASWEGLADAYLQRGSLNSAMKVYQKMSAMNEQNVYPKLQVANIKTTLRLFKEAIACYEELLTEHPTYVPALKGMAEAHLGLCYNYLSQRLLGRCKDHVAEAVKFLIKAIQSRNNYACVWRLLANAMETVAMLPITKASLQLPGSLVNVKDEELVTLKGKQLFELAARFYCRAIKIQSEDVLLWYELALSYYLQAFKYGGGNDKKQLLEMAGEVAKHTIKLSPQKCKNWNLLGVISAAKEINNLPLAQHCFIKALQLDKKSAISWTNLGVLYLTQGQIKLANKAFGRSQQADTGFINAWTGQALIAEQIGQSDEAMDLFKHCTSLGYTSESAAGFTHWVCLVLSNEEFMRDPKFYYAIENMHAVPLALDSIGWYCNAEDVNASLEYLCFLGYLSYNQRLWPKAIQSFKRAASLATIEIQRDQMNCNLGYSYIQNDEPLLAMEAFHLVTEATFKSTIGLALAHFKAKQYEESYSVYESALQWLATNDTEKSLVLVAMAAMIYAFDGYSSAKILFFQSIGLPNAAVEGLFAGCALGILHEDMQLSELVLKELKQYENNPKYAHHVVFLTSQFHLRCNNKTKALLYILSSVHVHPNNGAIRKILADFILKNFKHSEKYLIAASRIVEGSIALQLHHRNDLKCKNSSSDAAKSLAVASEAMRYVDQYARKQLAQRAVHLNPTCREAWAALNICKS